MKKYYYLRYIILCGLVIFSFSTFKSQILKYYTPKTIAPGGKFIITGNGFGDKRCSKCVVFFGTNKVFTYTQWSNRKITGKAPIGIKPDEKYELIIQTKDKILNTNKYFTGLPVKESDSSDAENKSIKVNYYSPQILKPNSDFTIVGSGFGDKRLTGDYIFFGTKKIFTYPSWSDTKIVGRSPKFISPGIRPIIIVKGTKKYNTGKNIIVLGISNIQQMPDPRSQILYGTANFINIYGVGFGQVQANGYVLVDKIRIPQVVLWSDTLVRIPLSEQIKPGKHQIYIVNSKGLRSKYRKTLNIRGIKAIEPRTDTVGGLISILGYGFGYHTKNILKLGNYTIKKFKKRTDEEITFNVPSDVLPGTYRIEISVLVSPYSKKYINFISDDSLTLFYRIKTSIGKVFGSFYTLSIRPAIFNPNDNNIVKFIYSIPNDCNLSMNLYNTSGVLISNLINAESITSKGRYYVNIEKKDLPSGSYKILMDINDKIKIIRSFDVAKNLKVNGFSRIQ